MPLLVSAMGTPPLSQGFLKNLLFLVDLCVLFLLECDYKFSNSFMKGISLFFVVFQVIYHKTSA